VSIININITTTRNNCNLNENDMIKKTIKDPQKCTDAGVEKKQAGDEDAIDVVHQRERQEGGKLHGPVWRAGTGTN
jgi:hypothetical protein